MDIARIPEHALKLIWEHQRFSAAKLLTTDGRTVVILSPGHGNTDGGPDFVDATIRIGPTTYSGDVELHCDAASWFGHRHETDPHYNRVILHVVLTDRDSSPPARTASRRVIPLLVLRPFIDDATVTTLTLSDGSHGKAQPRCCQCTDQVATGAIIGFLQHLGDERLEMKIRRYRERFLELVDEHASRIREPRMRYHGNPDEIPVPQRAYHRSDFTDRRVWEQLLYEGIMECLGYEKNRVPFLDLARAVPLEVLRAIGLGDPRATMALLFGEGGLLPSIRTVHDRESRTYVLALKRRWRELRPNSRKPRIHEGEWLFFRLRPSNFPTARLAAICFLLPSLFSNDAFRSLIGIFKGERFSAPDRIKRLHEFFRFHPDNYWQRHYHFRQSAHGKGIALGAARRDDIVVNCVIPVVLLYARTFGDPVIRNRAYDLYLDHLPLQENSVTRSVERNILHGKAALDTARLQQGALHLHQLYCSQKRCGECGFRTSTFSRAHR